MLIDLNNSNKLTDDKIEKEQFVRNRDGFSAI